MEWFKDIVKEYVKDEETLNGLVEKFNASFPLNAVPKKQYNDKVEELNTKTVELATASEQIEKTTESLKTLSSLEDESKEWKDKASTLERDLNEYKEGETTRLAEVERVYQVQGALENSLRTAKVNPELISILSGKFDKDVLVLSDDKKSFVGGYDDQIKALQADVPSAFLIEQTVDLNGEPPAGDNNEQPLTLAQKLRMNAEKK